MQEIFQSNLRMIELVNSLLNISRLEVGVLDSNIEDVDLGAAIQQVVDDASARAEKQKVLVITQAPTTVFRAKIDRNLAQILIQNIVVNAIKYTLPGGVVRISLVEVKSGETYNGKRAKQQSIGIAIADTGIGIPEGQKSSIFTKLFRADNARTVDTDGNGLGLYLAKKVVDHTGGQLWFTSTVGVGSTFFVLLPVEHSEK
jgi:signal transduction histidine kinase